MATLRTNTHKVQGEQPIISKRTAKKEETKIINLTINRKKITALLK